MKYWIGIVFSILATQVGFHLQVLGYGFSAGVLTALPYLIMYYIGVSEGQK